MPAFFVFLCNVWHTQAGIDLVQADSAEESLFFFPLTTLGIGTLKKKIHLGATDWGISS